jgi:uncharacterized protein
MRNRAAEAPDPSQAETAEPSVGQTRRSLRRGRLALALVLLAVGLSAVAGGHVYLARRLVLDPGIGEPMRSALLSLLALLFLSIFVAPVAERRLRPPRLRLVCAPVWAWVGILWMGVVALLAGDLLQGIMGAALAGGSDGRGFAAARALATVGVVAAAAAVGVRSALRTPAVRRVEVRLPRWPAALDGLRIAQISDIHIGPILGRAFAEALVARTNAVGADLIAVTGDLVDGPVCHLADEVAPFGGLAAPLGVYFVTGNHDVYSGGEPWAAHVRALGLRVLRNERVRLEHAGAAFDLAGVDDYRGDWVHGSTQDLEGALAGRDPDVPVVLLSHDPSAFRRAAAAGVDLQLSGHTHGGQIWPFRYLVRLVVPFVAGLYRVGASALYVSRGSGFWGPPIRLFAPAEITELTLRSAPQP